MLIKKLKEAINSNEDKTPVLTSACNSSLKIARAKGRKRNQPKLEESSSSSSGGNSAFLQQAYSEDSIMMIRDSAENSDINNSNGDEFDNVVSPPALTRPILSGEEDEDFYYEEFREWNLEEKLNNQEKYNSSFVKFLDAKRKFILFYLI